MDAPICEAEVDNPRELKQSWGGKSHEALFIWRSLTDRGENVPQCRVTSIQHRGCISKMAFQRPTECRNSHACKNAHRGYGLSSSDLKMPGSCETMCKTILPESVNKISHWKRFGKPAQGWRVIKTKLRRRVLVPKVRVRYQSQQPWRGRVQLRGHLSNSNRRQHCNTPRLSSTLEMIRQCDITSNRNAQ